jgi:hypothetical protein
MSVAHDRIAKALERIADVLEAKHEAELKVKRAEERARRSDAEDRAQAHRKYPGQ